MPVYTVDTGLLSVLSELRAIEKQAAEELGQWREKRALTVNGAQALTSITVQFVRPGEVRPSGGDWRRAVEREAPVIERGWNQRNQATAERGRERGTPAKRAGRRRPRGTPRLEPTADTPTTSGGPAPAVRLAGSMRGSRSGRRRGRHRVDRPLRRHEKGSQCFRPARSHCGKSDSESGLRSGAVAAFWRGRLRSVSKFVPTFAGRTGIRSGPAHGRNTAAGFSE
jgi:hypothetical protein